MHTSKTLGEFIQEEMRLRDMSAREFAEFINVPHSVINKFSNHGILKDYAGRPIGDPSVDFLRKLSRATKVDIGTIVAFVAPEEAQISQQARLLAERINQLPPDKQEIIDSFLLGAILKEQKKTDE